jgi:hypothetical protein
LFQVPNFIMPSHCLVHGGIFYSRVPFLTFVCSHSMPSLQGGGPPLVASRLTCWQLHLIFRGLLCLQFEDAMPSRQVTCLPWNEHVLDVFDDDHLI